MSLFRAVVICRAASEPRKEGTKAGYFCEVCNKELALSKKGREMIAAGGEPFCSDHGFAIAEQAYKEGLLIGTFMGAAVAAQVDKLIQRMKERHNAN